MTPELYWPCHNCGEWRRNHVGKERKCPFGPANFEPIDIAKSTHAERERIVDRLDNLESLFQKREEAIAKQREELDKVLMAVHEQCKHVDDKGVSMIVDVGTIVDLGTTEGLRRHTECQFCREDWYEGVG